MLREELEPRHFLEFVKRSADGETVVQKILGTKLRRERVTLFLNHLESSAARDKTVLKSFLAELGKLKMHSILEFLVPGKTKTGTRKTSVY